MGCLTADDMNINDQKEAENTYFRHSQSKRIIHGTISNIIWYEGEDKKQNTNFSDILF